MDWTTIIFLGLSIVSMLLLTGIIIIGARRTGEYKEIQDSLSMKSSKLDSDTKALRKALESSEAERKNILERLQNLEAIVTSEAYDTIKSGEEPEKIQLHIEEEETEEMSDAEKTAKIAKRVR